MNIIIWLSKWSVVVIVLGMQCLFGILIVNGDDPSIKPAAPPPKEP